MTKEHISRILELREILLSIQTGFSLVNAAVVCAILESITGLEPSSVITEPRYLKLVTVSSLWSRQHPSRTGPSRWRECNHRSHDNLQQDLADRRMANPMDPVLSHHTSQQGILQQCQNYRTISLISHPSKVMLKIILNRLKS